MWAVAPVIDAVGLKMDVSVWGKTVKVRIPRGGDSTTRVVVWVVAGKICGNQRLLETLFHQPLKHFLEFGIPILRKSVMRIQLKGVFLTTILFIELVSCPTHPTSVFLIDVNDGNLGVVLKTG